MRIISSGGQPRKLYASMELVGPDQYEFFLSAVEAVVAGRRPIARFDTRQALELEADRRGCVVVWQ